MKTTEERKKKSTHSHIYTIIYDIGQEKEKGFSIISFYILIAYQWEHSYILIGLHLKTATQNMPSWWI